MIAMNNGIVEDGSFFVQSSNNWIAIHQSNEVLTEYEEYEERVIRSAIKHPQAYIVEWRGDEFLDKFIEDFPLNVNAVIDNDHGLISTVFSLKNICVEKWLYSTSPINLNG